MPLKTNDTTNKSPVTNDNADTGYESIDVEQPPNYRDANEQDDDELEDDVWLQSMGIAEVDIKKLSSCQVDVLIINSVLDVVGIYFITQKVAFPLDRIENGTRTKNR